MNQAEREGKTMAVDFLLSMLRDATAPLGQRPYAATAVAPYLHCKLSAVRAIPTLSEMPGPLLDRMLAEAQEAVERAGPHERLATMRDQIQQIVENAEQALPSMEFTIGEKLIKAGEALLEYHRTHASRLVTLRPDPSSPSYVVRAIPDG